MIRAAQIKKDFGGKTVLNGVSFNIAARDIACFIGRNGCGKSTLLNIISGFLSPDSGTIAVESGLSIGYAPQTDILFEDLSVYDNLLFWASAAGVTKADIKSNGCIAALEVSEYYKKRIKHLSTGMKRRVSVACAVIKNPDIIILDEPFSGLDVFHKESLTRYLLDLNDKDNKTIVYTSHSAEETVNLCGAVFLIEDGKIAYSAAGSDSIPLFKRIAKKGDD